MNSAALPNAGNGSGDGISANGIIHPENLAHHGTASSLNYKDWDLNDVAGWLEEHLKLLQYKEVFGKFASYNILKVTWASMDLSWTISMILICRQTSESVSGSTA